LTPSEVAFQPIDTTDVDRWIGKPIGGLQLDEPVTKTDVRRWVQAMQNPNPLYYDQTFAERSVFGKLVAPQSFVIACAISHGIRPATQGNIPGCHHVFGGDEWWFPGPRIEMGDVITSERVAFDYRITNTRFAGPTVIQRGDTTYVNQRQQVVARQRLTAIRYLVANAAKVPANVDAIPERSWPDNEIREIEAERVAYARPLHKHLNRAVDGVRKGERVGRRTIGPHSIQSFTTEWRAYLFTVWGATHDDGLPTTGMAMGLLPEMAFRPESSIDPGFGDGLYYGSARGHTNLRYARLIGMSGLYGYGASMGAYVLDYVANWAGETGLITHSAIQYKKPVVTGDVTYLDGIVSEVASDGLVTLDVDMTNQDGLVLAKGPVTVQLSR
jgi:acyl dehydratase